MTTLKDYGFCADSRSDQTVAEAAHQWIEWSQVRRGRQPTTLLAYRHVMKHFLPWVGDMDVAAVTRMEIESFVTRKHQRVERPKPATLKREISILRAFFQWCEDEGLVERSPARGVHTPTVHNIQPRPIPDEQWRQWWGHDLPDSLRVALGLGFYGGLRRAEMVSLVVGQVTDEAILRFVRKGGGEHTLPWADMRNALKKRLPHLVDEDDLMLPALRRLRSRGDDAPLLAWASLDPGEVNKRVRRWAERHDLPPFTPHQLRHSTATNLLRARVPLHLVTSLLNHSSPTITMRYVAAGASQLTEYLSNQED
jgi:integrase